MSKLNDASHGQITMPISPKYHALYTQLRRDITDGKYPPHAQLPTEEWLCRSQRVSRGTVRKALDLLAAEGVIRHEQGRGVFVNPPSLSLLPFTLTDPAPTLEIRLLNGIYNFIQISTILLIGCEEIIYGLCGAYISSGHRRKFR